MAAISGTTLAPRSQWVLWTSCWDDCWVRSYYIGKSRSCNAWGLNLYNNGFAGGSLQRFSYQFFEIFEGIRQDIKERKAEA